jgi:hypothetical protein
MRGVCRRIGIFAVVLMVVTSMVAPSAMAASTTTTTAEDDGDACDEYGKYGQQLLGSLFSGQFDTLSDRCKAQDLVDNATHSDIYASALAQADLGKAGRTPASNHLDDSKTYARTIAKTEAVKLFNNESNGLNESQIKAEVNASIDDYYATMEKNLLTSHTANVNQLWFSYKAREDSTLADDTIQFDSYDVGVDPWSGSHSNLAGMFNGSTGNNYYFHLETQNVTTMDGETANMSMIRVEDSANARSYYTDITNTSNAGSYTQFYGFYTQNPNATYDGDLNRTNAVLQYNGPIYRSTYQDIYQTRDDMHTEAAAFVDLLYQNYNRSEGVDTSEVLNPNDLASQWNTNYNSTGYYGWIAATLGITGLEGNVNSSFAIDYTPRVDHYDNGNYSLNGSGDRDYAFVNGTSYNVSGTLMTDWDPNPNESYAFERGATYDTANADAPVLFIEQVNTNESRVIRLNGTFTVDTLTNVQTGEEVNSTSLEEQNQQTWNESSSVEEIRQLVEYRNKSVEINEAGGGGTSSGGLFDGFDFGSASLGFIVIAGGGLLLLSNRAS